MQDSISRKLVLAFIEVHILYHAKIHPIYGAWMMAELKQHGYEISAGTLYPIFHNFEKTGLLSSEQKLVSGKMRKYYSITEQGISCLESAKEKIAELSKEIE